MLALDTGVALPEPRAGSAEGAPIAATIPAGDVEQMAFGVILYALQQFLRQDFVRLDIAHIGPPDVFSHEESDGYMLDRFT